MYNRSAPYYDRLYHFKDYEAAAGRLHERIQERAPHARTLLDVACGTGRHLEHLRSHYVVEGLDINPGLLASARLRSPGVLFHQSDMTSFDLGRRFDVVTCLFSAIAYVRTLDNLYRTVRCLAKHVRPGGLVIVEPYFSPERYWVDHVVLNVADEPSLKLAWMYRQAREGNVAILDIHHLVGAREGVEYFCERHELGLFTDAQYEDACLKAGLTCERYPEGLAGAGTLICAQSPETR